MNSWINAALLVAAFVCFVLAALRVKGPVELVPAGLACWLVATVL